ncbi:hypothetical protein K466DRAFT_413420 [Polyporus arcularius HHB13444]|uniref:Fungal-type protein kinase domain-containing protein n=1 Tax=Polyporus arcularius HHB13444 TaxID=1314778 RepID=A0A5C3PK51_9APHY|nr:hypothetical protein K466DRAFT_413420 [Polyporus arcularius HHB13444]
MKDAGGTSITMRLSQYMDEVVKAHGNVPNGLAEKIHKALCKELGLPERKAADLTEKAFSDAWSKVAHTHNEFFPSFVFNVSQDEPEITDIVAKMRIDASLIRAVDTKIGGDYTASRPNWPLQRLPIEFKRCGTHLDPFDDDPDHKTETTAKSRRAVRAQVMTYAQRIFTAQRRKHLYMLLVIGTKFRIMRCDPSGVVASEAVDYVKSVEGTAALLDFVYAFSEFTDRQQGIDITAEPLARDSCGYRRMDAVAKAQKGDFSHHPRYLDPSQSIPDVLLPSSKPLKPVKLGRYIHHDPTEPCEDYDHLPNRLPIPATWTYIRDMFRKSLDGMARRYMITVENRKLLVGDHINNPPSSLIGRGTHIYVALDWESQQFVLLKDAWRPYYEGIRSEGEIVKELNAQEVPNVPTVVAHGDVLEDPYDDQLLGVLQETDTSNYSPLTGFKSADHTLPPFSTTPRPTKPLPGATGKSVARGKARAEHIAPTSIAGSTSGHGVSAPAGPQAKLSTTKAANGIKRSADNVKSEVQRPEQGTGLRHLVHYRVVFKEICLPLTRFTSSQQLVSLLIDCVEAHRDAYVILRLVHRDVSAGNMLIYPRIRCEEDENGKRHYTVVWCGILADWELAKKDSEKQACEPERTGTWHFMSMYCLDHPEKPVTIADELEAFLHVMVYCGVRLVCHNLKEVRGFVEDYFDGYHVNANNRFGAPVGKSKVLETGKLRISEVDNVIFGSVKDHPLNRLVADLLSLFVARYTLLYRDLDEQQQRASTPPNHRGAAPLLAEQPQQVPLSRKKKSRRNDEDAMDVDEPLGNRSEARLKERAAKLHTHDEFIAILEKWFDSDKWPIADTVPDRLPEHVAPTRESVKEDKNKKQRTSGLLTGSGRTPQPVASGSGPIDPTTRVNTRSQAGRSLLNPETVSTGGRATSTWKPPRLPVAASKH